MRVIKLPKHIIISKLMVASLGDVLEACIMKRRLKSIPIRDI